MNNRQSGHTALFPLLYIALGKGQITLPSFPFLLSVSRTTIQWLGKALIFSQESEETVWPDLTLALGPDEIKVQI